jgi:predicted SAM-dependent methyltransferase
MAADSLRALLASFGLLNAARALQNDQRQLRFRLGRRLSGADRRMASGYLRDATAPKLHIGCGANVLPGWLNTDRYPEANGVMHLDATRRFPLPDDAFDRAFSEHMIEHVSFADAVAMLRECHRVMRKGGRIRIATPDFAFLLDLCRRDPSELQRRYIEWSTQTFVAGAPYADATFVVNNFMRDWGHAFIHDERSLRSAFEQAGFAQIVRSDVGTSTDPAFRNLENESRMPPGFLRLETIVLEGAKP